MIGNSNVKCESIKVVGETIELKLEKHALKGRKHKGIVRWKVITSGNAISKIKNK